MGSVFFFFFLLFVMLCFVVILPGCSFRCYHLFSHEAQGKCTKQFGCKDGFSLLLMFRVAHKQYKVATLILINTSVLIKFRTVKMDNCFSLWPKTNHTWDTISQELLQWLLCSCPLFRTCLTITANNSNSSNLVY